MNIDDDHEKIMMHVFVQWMADNGILNAWLESVIHGKSDNAIVSIAGVIAREPDEACNYGFEWSLAVCEPVGYEGWDDVHNKWTELHSTLEDYLEGDWL